MPVSGRTRTRPARRKCTCSAEGFSSVLLHRLLRKTCNSLFFKFSACKEPFPLRVQILTRKTFHTLHTFIPKVILEMKKQQQLAAGQLLAAAGQLGKGPKSMESMESLPCGDLHTERKWLLTRGRLKKQTIASLPKEGSGKDTGSRWGHKARGTLRCVCHSESAVGVAPTRSSWGRRPSGRCWVRCTLGHWPSARTATRSAL